MNLLRLWSFVLAVAALISLSGKVCASDKTAPMIDAVVTVVHEKVLLLSELRDHARPFIARLHKQLGGKRDAKLERKIFQQLLKREIEAALIAHYAREKHIRATAQHVDKALQSIAAQQKIPVAELFEQVRTTAAMNEAQYRAEIRRQVLEGMVLQRLVSSRKQPTNDAARLKALEEARRELIAKLRREIPVDVRVRFR